MDLTVYMDVQQNPGPPFDEFGSGYASLVTTNLNSRSACSGRISYSRWELLRLKTKYYLSLGLSASAAYTPVFTV